MGGGRERKIAMWPLTGEWAAWPGLACSAGTGEATVLSTVGEGRQIKCKGRHAQGTIAVHLQQELKTKQPQVQNPE